MEEEGGGWVEDMLPCLPVRLEGGGGGGWYAVSLSWTCRAHTFLIIIVLYIWVQIEIRHFKEERNLGAGKKKRCNDQPIIKDSIGSH